MYFNRKLFLATLIVVLAVLFVVQAAGPGTGADVPPGKAEAAAAAMGEDTPSLNRFPNPQTWIDTSPYAHEPISISSGAAGLNLFE